MDRGIDVGKGIEMNKKTGKRRRKNAAKCYSRDEKIESVSFLIRFDGSPCSSNHILLATSKSCRRIRDIGSRHSVFLTR